MPNCRICKKPLPRFQHRGRKRRYCSHPCKIRAYRARKKNALPKKFSKPTTSSTTHQATCLVCEQPLTHPKRGRKRKYCCASCKQKGYRNRRNVIRETYRKALQNNLLRLNHKSVEWHTSPEYISAVREVLGEICLDPASNETANQTVGALRYFDKETNGLVQSWLARSIYLNPPHDRKYPVGPWVDKLLAEYRAGHVESAILLVDAATSASWFQPLYAYSMCFVHGRIAFVSGDGKNGSQPINGSVFVYLGHQPHIFARVFERFGKVFYA